MPGQGVAGCWGGSGQGGARVAQCKVTDKNLPTPSLHDRAQGGTSRQGTGRQGSGRQGSALFLPTCSRMDAQIEGQGRLG